MHDYTYLNIERQGHITWLTLDRPEALNALSDELLRELEHAARSFEDDEQTRVIIIRGNGKHFSAGADLKQKAPEGEIPSLLMQRRILTFGARVIKAIVGINQVTIAAIHGVALGGAACVVSACDFRIGTKDCAIGYPEVNLGINLMWGGLPLCVHLVGASRAKRMIMLGNHESAQTLLNWGYLDEVVEKEELTAKALSMAEDYASRPPIAVQMIKQGINTIRSKLDQEIMHMETDQTLLALQTNDREEGMRAFMERRDPDFKGN
jgi:enoyl-CoA hydratase/carnithine racemase